MKIQKLTFSTKQIQEVQKPCNTLFRINCETCVVSQALFEHWRSIPNPNPNTNPNSTLPPNTNCNPDRK